MRSNFLDISKAFDKVWHEGLLFKLKTIDISGNLTQIISSFLSDRQQRLVLNGQHSNWAPALAGAHQGSILQGCYRIFMNDFPDFSIKYCVFPLTSALTTIYIFPDLV